jgi:hypothetical protein
MTDQHAPFSLWTVYDSPKDYRGLFVARKFTLAGPTPSVISSEDLGAIRDTLARMGLLVPMARSPEDDPVIIETWI